MDKKIQTQIDIEGLRKKLLKQTEQHKNAPKRIKVGIEGDAKTGKTGLAVDMTKKTFYLDVDNGSRPTWKANHNSTDRIIIYNPAATDEETGEFLPYQTQGNIRSFIALAKETAKTEEIVFVWDGVDTWLDYCTLYMTGMETSRMRPMKTAKQQDWFHRNQPFREVMKEVATKSTLLILSLRLETKHHSPYGIVGILTFGLFYKQLKETHRKAWNTLLLLKVVNTILLFLVKEFLSFRLIEQEK